MLQAQTILARVGVLAIPRKVSGDSPGTIFIFFLKAPQLTTRQLSSNPSRSAGRGPVLWPLAGPEGSCPGAEPLQQKWPPCTFHIV